MTTTGHETGLAPPHAGGDATAASGPEVHGRGPEAQAARAATGGRGAGTGGGLGTGPGLGLGADDHHQRSPDRVRSGVRVGRALGLGLVLVVVLAASVCVAVTLGPASITVADVLASLGARLGASASGLSPMEDGIIWNLRMPRVLTAAAVGAGLALCGAVMQATTRNPLSDPYLLGLSSGASVGAVVALLVGAKFLLPAAAFIGAMAALLATLGLAQLAGGLTPARTILAGVAVSSLAGALTSLLIFWNAQGDSYRNILSWLMGSLSGADWHDGVLGTVAVVVIGVPLIASARLLDAFAFGDDAAVSLGVRVERVRWLMLAATAVLTGILVSMSGAIGFVGLVVPHAVRLIVGPGYRAVLPVSALGGAVLLLWADTLARTAFDPRELPVGIVTAVLGAPVFALLLARRKGGAA